MSTTTPESFQLLGPIGFIVHGGSQRYLLEARSTTGFVAWRLGDGTILVSMAEQVSIAASPMLSFWACAGYQDTTPAGRILSFDCHDNGLVLVDVRKLTGLEYLDCSCNKLRELSLEGLTHLQALDADRNQLTHLEVRHLRSLRVLHCAHNKLNMLDVSGLGALQVLDCSHNPLQSLNIDGCGALKDCRP